MLEEPGRERVFDVPEEFQASPVSQPPVSQSPVSGGDGAVWGRLLDQYKGRLPVNHRVFLNMASGVLEGDCLAVYCNTDFAKTSLDNTTVLTVLREVTSRGTEGGRGTQNRRSSRAPAHCRGCPPSKTCGRAPAGAGADPALGGPHPRTARQAGRTDDPGTKAG